MRPHVLRRLRPVLDAQEGVITSAQLRAAGVALGLPRREGWTRLADSTWVVHDAPADDQLLAAWSLYAPAAIPSGVLACRWHGLRHVPDRPGGDALLPHGSNLLGGPLLRTRQTRRMPAAVTVRGRGVAPPVRAVADAARWSASRRDVRALVLAALADGQVDRDALGEEVRAGQLAGSAHLRSALQDWDRGARSAPEAEAVDLLLDQGRLPFLVNPRLVLDGVLLGAPDGWLPAAGLGWEIDSREHHAEVDDLDATLRRHQSFADAGLLLLHVTPSRLRQERRAWAAEVLRRAESRVREGWQPPAGLVVHPAAPLLLPGSLAA